MEHYKFKHHSIVRSATKTKSSYTGYKDDLMTDFHSRCCYCNMPQSLIASSFHIDHFIPKKEFEGKKDFLLNDYNNLMLACPKCNRAKGDLYKGDLLNDDSISNGYFYNPVKTDFNNIFYRDKYGAILSDDNLGNLMIKELKLYRPIYKVAWLTERCDILAKVLQTKIDKEIDEDKKKKFEYAQYKLLKEFRDLSKLLISAYNSR